MMNRIVELMLVAIAGFLSTGVQAASVNIDFESSALGADPVLIDGFEIAATDGLFSPGVVDDGGNRVFEASYNDYCPDFSCNAAVTISRTDRAAFAFLGADIEAFAVGVPPTESVIGKLTGGGTVQFGNYGEGDWLNVISVEISISSFCTTNCFFDPSAVIQVDNISLGTAAVPIPAAVWLFGSALAGLGWLRRKSTV